MRGLGVQQAECKGNTEDRGGGRPDSWAGFVKAACGLRTAPSSATNSVLKSAVNRMMQKI